MTYWMIFLTNDKSYFRLIKATSLDSAELVGNEVASREKAELIGIAPFIEEQRIIVG